MKHVRIAILCGLFAATGCRVARVTIIPVDERGGEVPNAAISINGQPVGQGTTQMQSPRQDTSVTVDARPRYYPNTFVVTAKAKGPIQVPLRPDEIYALTVDDTNKVVNRWLTINISETARKSWWSVIINALGSQDMEMELMDSQSGFIRTAWKERRFGNQGLRRRFVGNVVTTEPLAWRLKYQVQRTANGRDWSDYDRGVKEELDVIAEIRGRM